MDKNYIIDWYNSEKSILHIRYLGDTILSDIFSANVEAFSMIETVTQAVFLIHDGQTYNIALNLLNIGKMRDSVYSKFPPIPANLKLVIVVLQNRTARMMMGSTLEVLDRVFYKHNMTAAVASMQEAETLIGNKK